MPSDLRDRLENFEPLTRIKITCRECDAVSTTTELGHSKDSKQYGYVLSAAEAVAEQHADETGHEVDVDEEVLDDE